MDALPEAMLWSVFLRLDFLELHSIRRTSPQFEALVQQDLFLRDYNRECRGSVWNFTHFRNHDVLHEHHVVGHREDAKHELPTALKTLV
ncbi:putative F-box domain-containing protein [Helianthus annuus]|uniref:F-box domain-containing protein n=2 Tax=Helianthus annuus TaxID=4232 RepID=A0A9K3N636_HELAN|nr:putative F-box domain-containing protein [Helianthus annuus]KAJ0515297.1 putative F-box domain-containing protein [Helianthus annuus]KAJ0531492.1 putative F-box domain-containing protein [Helianthus annuus]KAJ0698332.1 putative F-box domain-containing protein [Helianthus annuus]KAJ0881415.1 putative F-box domain-containing protein [Helianthus annuus]